MNELDDLLRDALQRREPPPGFAERVMARVPRRPPVFVWWRQMAAIAALLVVTVSSAMYERHREMERRRAEQASHELIFALRFTAARLEHVRYRVEKSSPVVKVERDEVKGNL
jgi:hypothetical protein